MPDTLKRFEFPIKVTKAYTKVVKNSDGDEEKKYYVEAIASDTGIDYYMERMSENAIDGMVKQSKEEEVIILPTHWDTFHIGKTVDAEKVDGETTKDGTQLKALKVTIELDMKYPQSQDLYNEVAEGKSEKQLSVGGWLNPENEDAAYWEETEVIVIYPDGTEKKRSYWILVLDDLILDHIAITRAGHAANDRTGFLSAISKSLRSDMNEKFEVLRTNTNKLRDLNVVKTKITSHLPVEESVKTKTAEEKEKAVSHGKEIDEVRSGVIDFFKTIFSIKTKSIEKEDEDEVPDVNDVNKEKAQDEVVNGATNEELKAKSDDTQETTEAAQENIDVDELKSKIMDEVNDKIKSVVNDKLGDNFIESIQKSVSDTVNKTVESFMKDKLNPLTDRLDQLDKTIKSIDEKIKAIESATAESSSIDGQDSLDVSKSTDEKESVWKGLFVTDKAVEVIRARKAAMMEEQEDDEDDEE